MSSNNPDPPIHFLIYKTTCLVTNKYYIGKHRTRNLNDGYIGSGVMLRHAIKKYGKENFKTEILHECSSQEELDALERQLVVPDRATNYNLAEGGKGGWSYVNRELWTKEKITEHNRKISPFLNKQIEPDELLIWQKRGGKAAHAKGVGMFSPGRKNGMLGKKMSEEAKAKISKARKAASRAKS